MSKYKEVAHRCANTGQAFLYDLQANYSMVFQVEIVTVILLAVWWSL
ncbi:MAG: hypothetical protein Q7T96_00915 [Methylobacter sp.]|nr:hypothetical protein [Methylobacter sp.]